MQDVKNMSGKACENGQCCHSGCGCSESKHDCKSWGLLILRVMLAIIFIYHGYGKLFGSAPGMTAFTGMVGMMGFPLPALFAYIAALVEFLGGIAMLLGVFVRPAGYLLSVVMVVAIAFAKKFAYPAIEIDLALLAMSLSVALMGSGKYALMQGKMVGKCLGSKCQGGKCDGKAEAKK